jgi:hypothetical protein
MPMSSASSEAGQWMFRFDGIQGFHGPPSRSVYQCQGTAGSERWRTRELHNRGHQNCTLAATRTARVIAREATLPCPEPVGMSSTPGAFSSGVVSGLNGRRR